MMLRVERGENLFISTAREAFKIKHCLVLYDWIWMVAGTM